VPAVLEEFKGERSIAEICRKYQISEKVVLWLAGQQIVFTNGSTDLVAEKKEIKMLGWFSKDLNT
jgi:hypothetical protein